ncbi:MAG: polysaccharide export protein, partial [Desulfobacterales bacterium]|nr:polysaccharide export protein [Desulfobacterales bacterium]
MVARPIIVMATFIVGFLMASFALPASTVSADANEKIYKIGKSDVLLIKVYAGGELQHESESTVSSGGMVDAPLIGQVKALGLTAGQLEEAIRKPLAEDYLVNPGVSVSIEEYHSLHYYISGAVKEPGLLEMASNASLLEVIAKAGGVLPEA